MRFALAALLLPVLFAAAVPTHVPAHVPADDPIAPEARPPARSDAQLVALPGPLSPEAMPLLARTMSYYGDFGPFALGEATPGQLFKLQRLGLEPMALGAWPQDAILMAGPAHEMPADASVLFARGDVVVAAVPAASNPTASCHHLSIVKRQAWRPGTGFAGVPGTPAPVGGSLGGPGSVPGGGVVDGIPQAVSVDPRITPLVAQVNQTNLENTVSQLNSYFTRRATTNDILLAKDWLVGQLNAIPGLVVSTDTFDNSYAPKVIAEIPGQVTPDQVVVLGAHYDSINGSGSAFSAPGADDNASGSAGILEAARILATGQFENTIRIVWFSAEEFGLIGADADASALAAANVPVVAMLNMDMIAYRAAGDPHDLDLVTNSTDPALTAFCGEIAEAYVPSLPVVNGTLSGGSSDHAAYQGHGFPAAFYFEDTTASTPWIHTSGDTYPQSANNFALASDITRAFIAAAATLAGPVDMTLSHAPLADTIDASGPYPIETDVASLTAATVADVTAFYSVNGGLQQSTALMPGNVAGTWVGSIPGVGAAGTADVAYHLLATDSDGHQQWLPQGLLPGAKTFRFTVGDIQAVFADDFEGPTDNGWVHQQVIEQDDWQRGIPAGKAGDPSAAASGSEVWGNDLGPDGYNGSYKPDVHNWLESPTINTVGMTGLHLRFQRWLNVEDGWFDQATIEVDGTPVWSNPATGGGGSNHVLDTDWNQQDLDVSAQADNDPDVRIRFRLESDGGLEFGGWNIDDLQLATVGPGTTNALTASAVHLSAGDGGAIAFDLDAGPGFGGRTYVMAIGVTGTSPGTSLGGVTAPLNFDVVTQLGFAYLNTPIFDEFYGTLSGSGTATATFNSPPAPDPALAGIPISFAFLTLSPIDYASNAVTVEYQP